MTKICIILSTLYDQTIPAFYNDEVQQDLDIIYESLGEYEILPINLPFKANRSFSQKTLFNALHQIHFPADSTCHIVLNTHGSPGHCDLNLELITQLVEWLSHRSISISQISALMCDGMKAEYFSPDTIVSMSIYKHAPKMHAHEASMQTLQKKLNALTTKMPQSFYIRGFDFAYTPNQHKQLIVELLKGNAGEYLNVQIHAKTFSSNDIFQIHERINIISEHQQNHLSFSKKEQTEHLNFFSSLLEHMKNNIVLFLENQQIPTFDSDGFPLWHALVQHARQESLSIDILNPVVFLNVYRNWIKSHKWYSQERLAIFTEFANLLAQKLEEEIIRPGITK